MKGHEYMHYIPSYSPKFKGKCYLEVELSSQRFCEQNLVAYKPSFQHVFIFASSALRKNVVLCKIAAHNGFTDCHGH